jgi:DNA polymerase/3'-5' exonuclease PolX
MPSPILLPSFVRRGRTRALKSCARTCRGVVRDPGTSPGQDSELYDALGVASLDELEAAAKEDRVRPVKGLGASLQIKILQNLAIAKSGDTQLHLHKAAALLEHAVEMAGLMLCLA